MTQPPIPASVLQTWPTVPADAWRWLSERRLYAPHRMEGFRWLVVVAYGETVGRPTKEGSEAQRAVYAGLFETAARAAAHRDACAEGTPAVRPDSKADDGVVGRCWWCGRWPHEHSPGAAAAARVQLGEVAAVEN
jgi:hypothetical protein